MEMVKYCGRKRNKWESLPSASPRGLENIGGMKEGRKEE
jgi:hypothetical protein